MIRVVYEWRVGKAEQAQFVVEWQRATTTIRASVDGARGSTLLRSRDDPDVFLSIARWESAEHWLLFWKDPERTEMREMHALAERLSVAAYEEIGDFTV